MTLSNLKLLSWCKVHSIYLNVIVDMGWIAQYKCPWIQMHLAFWWIKLHSLYSCLFVDIRQDKTQNPKNWTHMFLNLDETQKIHVIGCMFSRGLAPDPLKVVCVCARVRACVWVLVLVFLLVCWHYVLICIN